MTFWFKSGLQTNVLEHCTSKEDCSPSPLIVNYS